MPAMMELRLQVGPCNSVFYELVYGFEPKLGFVMSSPFMSTTLIIPFSACGNLFPKHTLFCQISKLH